jgi:Est1 DNA/RNA binding domain/Telomerase activating protein Est1
VVSFSVLPLVLKAYRKYSTSPASSILIVSLRNQSATLLRGLLAVALAADEPVSVDLTMKHLILRSCHATLIHLGDLSRYRETELHQQQRNWGPAKGYYELAAALDPADGTSFNQLAVISLADNDHLRAVYYLYRALCIQKPAPQTLGNLEVEFKKVLRHHRRGEPLLPPEAKNASRLVSSFLVYHAACYMAPDSSDFEGQRAALIVEFEKELRTKPFDSSFRKMCIINIAAVQHAQVRKGEHSESDAERTLKLATSVKEAHDLNVAICTTLFALLAATLRHGDQEQEQVSPLVRRLLPLLRLYSAWLLTNTSVLGDTKVPGPQPLKLWAVYAEALSLLVSSFPIQGLPNVPYLLEEDLDVVSFSAFSDLVRKFHFYDSNGSLKPSRGDAGVSTSTRPDQEMLFRIKKLVVVGLHLSTEKVSFPSYSFDHG